MAAAYAAVVSLMNTIQQIANHPFPPISLVKPQVESLTEKVNFFQEFLEGCSHVADELESRIADAAYAAEDVIESHIVDRIHADEEMTADFDEEGSSIEFYEALQKVVQDMDLIKTEVMEMKGKMRRNYSYSSGSSTSPSATHNGSMVGFDDVLIEVLDKLTRGQAGRQIIPIIGMAGIGKTALARNVYVNPLIQHHFDICAWSTISQDYSTLEILREVLCLGSKERKEHLNNRSQNELGEMLYKHLSGRRYLIVMDDMWSIEAWDKIKFFFPDYNNGSRIIITTRLSNLASQLTDSYVVVMKLLDEDKIWDLFKSMFGQEEGCPLKLEEIGNKIVRACKGLPLSIVVIGGLLAKFKDVQEYWEYIAENLNSVVNLEDNERCLKILQMSYDQLPVYLKPCFLYVGVFPEDDEIRVSRLVKLWVAEGFLKPIDGLTLEIVAEKYLKELIDRNLISVHELGSNGKTKLCKIHDLLRDLCLKEAQKERFLFVVRKQSSRSIPQGGINTKRRICIHRQSENPSEEIHALETASLARSFLSDSIRLLPSFNFRLLRVSSIVDNSLPFIDKPLYPEAIAEQVNLRYLAVEIVFYDQPFRFPPSIYFFWNLQTLIVDKFSVSSKIVRFQIWWMPLLRHIKFDTLELVDPPMDDESGDIVLENLQTLSRIYKLKFGDEVVKRIPSIKKLELSYDKFEEGYSLNNLGRLHKLESLNLSFQPNPTPSSLKVNIMFPHSLKKLTLLGTSFSWEDITAAIGSLPRLEVLKLKFMSFVGPEWETVEGQFCSLKYLLISEGCSLKYWTTESSTHFPRLERLILEDLHCLEEIPSSIGDIPTLQLIYLEGCGNSAVDSAKRILQEQEELGNFDLKVLIHSDNYEDEDGDKDEDEKLKVQDKVEDEDGVDEDKDEDA